MQSVLNLIRIVVNKWPDRHMSNFILLLLLLLLVHVLFTLHHHVIQFNLIEIKTF